MTPEIITARLLDIEAQLQGVARDLRALINQPKKATKLEDKVAKYTNLIEKRHAKKKN
jgi:hypothetical protein